ncbi:MAG: LacI family DNA-binding transcriptional regulator [Pseudomonadota bacterium]
MATIRDVAERAGISVKTVSRFLSGYEGISAKTAEKIERAAEELEFYPSAAARTLRGQSTDIVSLIAENLTTTPFSYEIVQGVQSVCEEHGKLLLIGETRESEKAFEQLTDRFRQQKTEAIIHATFYHKPVNIKRQFKRCPLILVNCFDPEGRFPAVVPDDEQGSYDLTRFLIDEGHRRIANITLPTDLVATQLRQQGFERAMADSGATIHPSWIVHPQRLRPTEDMDWLGSVLESLLESSNPPTAIMCGNDKMALRAIMQLHDRGVKVPDDISVVGFDDFKVISENVIPALTTASLPYYQMGQRAAEIAIDIASGKQKRPDIERSNCEVIRRNSHAAVPSE